MNEIIEHRGDQPATVEDAPTPLDAILSVIDRASRDPSVDVDKMERLFALQDRMLNRAAEAAFVNALVRASGAIPRVKKNGTIDLGVDKNTGKPRGTMAFAKWEDVDAVLRPIMQREGFTLLFDSTPRAADGGGLVITATLLHDHGHSKSVSLGLALDTGAGRNNLQAMGSTLSYGKRYCAEMLFNIVREGVDDDGKAGGTVYITQADADALQRDAQAAAIPIDGFLDYMGVEAFDHIEVKDLAKARNAIKVSQAKKGKT